MRMQIFRMMILSTKIACLVLSCNLQEVSSEKTWHFPLKDCVTGNYTVLMIGAHKPPGNSQKYQAIGEDQIKLFINILDRFLSPRQVPEKTPSPPTSSTPAPTTETTMWWMRPTLDFFSVVAMHSGPEVTTPGFPYHAFIPETMATSTTEGTGFESGVSSTTKETVGKSWTNTVPPSDHQMKEPNSFGSNVRASTEETDGKSWPSSVGSDQQQKMVATLKNSLGTNIISTTEENIKKSRTTTISSDQTTPNDHEEMKEISRSSFGFSTGSTKEETVGESWTTAIRSEHYERKETLKNSLGSNVRSTTEKSVGKSWPSVRSDQQQEMIETLTNDFALNVRSTTGETAETSWTSTISSNQLETKETLRNGFNLNVGSTTEDAVRKLWPSGVRSDEHETTAKSYFQPSLRTTTPKNTETPWTLRNGFNLDVGSTTEDTVRKLWPSGVRSDEHETTAKSHFQPSLRTTTPKNTETPWTFPFDNLKLQDFTTSTSSYELNSTKNDGEIETEPVETLDSTDESSNAELLEEINVNSSTLQIAIVPSPSIVTNEVIFRDYNQDSRQEIYDYYMDSLKQVNDSSEYETNDFYDLDMDATIEFARQAFNQSKSSVSNSTRVVIMVILAATQTTDIVAKVRRIQNEEDIMEFKLFIIMVGFQEKNEMLDIRNIINVDTLLEEEYPSIAMAICKQCQNGWHMFEPQNGTHLFSCYYFSNAATMINWNQGFGTCKKMGAALVSIESSEERLFLERALQPYLPLIITDPNWLQTEVFIGLSRNVDSKAKSFQWINGHPLVPVSSSLTNARLVHRCGVWVFYKSVNDWKSTPCGFPLTSFSICERVFARPLDSSASVLSVKPANEKSFNKALSIGEFTNYNGKIVSVPANARDPDLEQSLLE